MSLGHPIYAPAANDPLVQAVQQASAAGLIVVTSAGNYGQEPDDRAAWLRGHHVALQRAVRDLRRRREHAEHGGAQRRRRRAVQLARAVVV